MQHATTIFEQIFLITVKLLATSKKWLKVHEFHDAFHDAFHGRFTVGSMSREVFERLGFRHTSLDINGRDGAVVVDLSRQGFLGIQWQFR